MISQSLTANVLRKRSIELINLTIRSYKCFAAAFVCLALCLAMITLGLVTLNSEYRAKPGKSNFATESSTSTAPIPFSELGAKATADYKGDGIGITATADGAQLRTDFQKLSAVVSSTGLQLDSTAAKGGRLRLSATSIGRNAINDSKSATRILSATGTVAVAEKVVTYTRPGLTEEYGVSADGLRQDFIVAERPDGPGELSVELALDGARAKAAADGAQFTLTGSGRELAYNKLRVVDSIGRDLKARIDILSPGRLAVQVDDMTAVYPVRIDPTFSDSNWVSLNPGIPGVNGDVSAMVADGSGNLYVAGNFTFAGTVPANVIAKWDGSAWSTVGSIVYNPSFVVRALAVIGTDLYAGGNFPILGGVSASNIAKWNGSTWSALGSGTDFSVQALAVIGTDLYVGGVFLNAGGAPASRIAKWNGSAWSTLGSGFNGNVSALAVIGTDLFVGGFFTTAGGVSVSNIAKWNGSAWSALGSGADSQVTLLAVIGTDLYAGGTFNTAGGVSAPRVAKWNGSAWSALGSGLNGSVSALAVMGTDLYVGGGFTTAGGAPAARIAKWDGSVWSALGSGMDNTVNALAVVGANVYAGGTFSTAGGVLAVRIAKWDGSAWSALGLGVDNNVYALAVIGTDLYVGGQFNTAAGVTASHIAKWDGTSWSALGSGVSSGSAYNVSGGAVIGTDLYVGGFFNSAGGVPASNIAKWNGSAWSAVGGGTNTGIQALAVIGTDLYAGGFFSIAGGVSAPCVAKWNGSAWSALGSGVTGNIRAMAVSGTNLYVAGNLGVAGGVSVSGVAKWNGSAWSALGSGTNGTVFALAVSGTDLYAGGSFTTAGGAPAARIAKWDGSVWSALGSGMDNIVNALAVSGTNLYAGGNFSTAGGVPAVRIAKWDGSAWSALGSGVSDTINALTADSSNHLFVGGNFYLVGTTISPFVAEANLPAAADGSGTISVAPSTAQAGTTQSFTFTYTADPDGLSNGEIDITIPAGWSGGSATSSTGSAVINSGVIKVTGITLAGGSMMIGLNNVTVSSTAGAHTFNTQEKSTSGGTLTSIAVQPVVNVTAVGTLASFAAHSDFAVGSRPSAVATGDFNGDGKPDLAVTNYFSASVSILLGTGTGSLGAKTDFGTGNNPQSVAVGDFNGDGNLDLAVANINNTVSILLGTGTGSFGAKIDFGSGNNPNSVAVGDFNGDGKLDLAVANLNGGVSILLGTGTGSFGVKTDFVAGNNPDSVAIGDFNGDGKLDLAVANAGSATVSILLGTGTGSFGAKTDFGTGTVPKSVAVADLNGDGKPDLAVANSTGDSVSVLLGTGTGSFGAKTDFSTGNIPFSVVIGDFNGDGKFDLAVANNGNGFGNTVSVLLGTGSGSFGARTDLGAGAGPTSVAVGDFNRDGKLDLAMTNQVDDTVGIFINTNTAKPLSPLGFSAHNDFASGGSVESIAGGDFNGDGKTDLVLANSNASSVSILLGTGTGTFGAKTDFATGGSPLSVAVGDFNGDGKLDLAVTSLAGQSVSILLGTGTGAFGAKTDFTTGTNPASVAVGDFNGDGKLDLAVANAASNTVSILLGTGTGAFGAKTDFGTGSSPVSVEVGDFNGDGKLDLAVTNSSSNSVSILLGLGTGSFGAKTDFATGVSPSSVAVGDFDRNGKLDLAVSNLSGNTVSVLLGTGTGAFAAKTDFGTGGNPKAVRVGDFNGDGKLDLVLPEIGINSVSVLLGTGTGSFGTRIDFATAATPRSVAIGDFNGDGAPDLATGNGNNISILLNTSPGPATNLVVTDVNGGVNPLAGTPFSVTVRSNDNSGTPANVTADTSISLSLKTGAGTLIGTLTGTITAGNKFASISGVIYSKAESGVVITATRTSGDNLLAADSAPITVSPNGVYTDPAGVCGGNTPCFSNLQTAINSLGSGGILNIGAGTYNQDVNFNASATYNINGNISVNNVTLSAGTVVGGNFTITVSGNWTNNGGTFTTDTSTVNVTGAGTIGGSSSTIFNNLTINGSGITTLGQNETVNGILALTSDLNTGAFTLTMPNTASSSGTGDVIGTVNRTGFVSGGPALSFGNPFNAIQINSGAAPTDISVKLTETVPTDSSTGQTNSGFSNAVTRTYVITPNGGSGISATLQLHYKLGDLNGNSEASLNLWRFDSGTGKWNNMGASAHDIGNHAVTQTGITQFSPWTLNSVVPTAADLETFTATADVNGTLLQWQTGFEVNNLGFNVYRQGNGERVRINPTLIAGSALTVGSDVKVEAGYSYNWLDEAVDKIASYWLEDIDLDGTSTWHGPYGVTSASTSRARGMTRTKSVLLNNLAVSANRNDNAVTQREYPAGFTTSSNYGPAISQTNGRTPTKPNQIPASLQKQWQIASQPAIKIAINKTGWYHVNMTDLMAAGLSANPATLQLFVGGIEVPIKVNADSIEFYGVAVDTPTSDTQVYWLTSGMGSGKRIGVQASPGATNNNGPSSFQYTVERKERTVYFSSLKNGDAENWFGSVVATQPVTNTINIHNLDTNYAGQAQLEIALQGVTTKSHQVTVMVNGQAIHAIAFEGMDHKITKLSLPVGALIEGNNQITFTAGASGGVSLVDYIRVTYAHTYTADNNMLSTTAVSMQPIKVTGFTSNQITAIDVANPSQPIELAGTIDGDTGNYAISVDGGKRRNLLVFTADKMLRPLSITVNQPSTLINASNGADFIIIANKDFAAGVQPLAALRQSQGYQVSVVDVENIYDEFSYGVHSPQAVKDFLNWTYTHWQHQPQFAMLAGSGTLDPRNYSGLGFMDFVPTKLIDTSSMETASDDWFVDFNNDGQPQMAIGRLPVRTAAEMTTVVNKIIAYEHSGNPEAMVLVSDLNDGVNFNANNNRIKSIAGSQIATTDIVRGQTNTDAKTALMDQLTKGQRIFNYAGHGSVNLWRGNLLTDGDVQALTNTKVSPLVVTMTCLNGYFQDPKLASLGESLLKVNNGGAVSVWASSGMTDAGNQTALNQGFFRQLFGNTTITIGQAIKAAKTAAQDNDVRRTWILFGDPTMKIRK